MHCHKNQIRPSELGYKTNLFYLFFSFFLYNLLTVNIQKGLNMAKKNNTSGQLKSWATATLLSVFLKNSFPANTAAPKMPVPVKKEVPVPLPSTNYDAIKLNTIEDMYNLFDMSLNIIFAELTLEEVPMKNAYDDNGLYRGKKNTIGTGSTYSPLNIKDYNNPDAKWYHLARNPKTFGNRTVSYKEMLQLVVGWAKYRKITQSPKTGNFVTQKTVLERMFAELQGASLRPNEFSGLFCAVYNNENNIDKLCPYIKDNYKTPIACANKIMTWSSTGAANGGTRDRCEFEALVYLNSEDFCSYMMALYTKPLKKTGCSCINTKGVTQKTLTKDNYKQYSRNALTKYKGIVYSGGVCTSDVCTNAGWAYTNPLYVSTTHENELQKGYDEAIKVYQSKDYENALKLFLALEQQGASGADLWNDIAIAYYKLKHYDNCIEYCKKILKTTEYGERAKACYNAGLAYEAKGNYNKAIINYEKALEYYNKYGISDPNPNVDYEQIYKTAKARAVSAKQVASQKNKEMASIFKTGQQRVATAAVTKNAKNRLAVQNHKTGPQRVRS